MMAIRHQPPHKVPDIYRKGSDDTFMTVIDQEHITDHFARRSSHAPAKLLNAVHFTPQYQRKRIRILAGVSGIHMPLPPYECCCWHHLSVKLHRLLLHIKEGVAQGEVVDAIHACICGKLWVNVEEDRHVDLLACIENETLKSAVQQATGLYGLCRNIWVPPLQDKLMCVPGPPLIGHAVAIRCATNIRSHGKSCA